MIGSMRASNCKNAVFLIFQKGFAKNFFFLRLVKKVNDNGMAETIQVFQTRSILSIY
jgi:hypothetical protein